ncbi:alginate lyase family protein [Paenibacillus koleovorans]|uniref:alginate lyase family protein n=1 Tax=Paenibacillus koleovorans TaxID=121608 RepID=UPI000FDC41E0|nr:alginate lyase family protein [Paenibacillus koleovorans]
MNNGCAADKEIAAFLGLIDLGSAGLEEVRALSVREQWEEAMAAYMAIFQRKLKAAQLLPLPANPQFMEDAELLLDNRISLLNSPLVPIGDPIDWLLTPGGDKQWQSHLGYMYFPNCLIQAYEATGEARYRDKWLAIMRDFTDRHPYGAKQLEYDPHLPLFASADEDGVGGEGRYPGYAGGSWISLACAARTERWLPSLKALAAMEALDTDIVRRMVTSLMTDHAFVMIRNRRKYPNQRLHVAVSLITLGIVLHEFKLAPACYQIGMQRLEEYVGQSLLPDGSDLEQSFNYNTALPNNYRQLWPLIRDVPKSGLKSLKETVGLRCEFMAWIIDPLKQWPAVAKTHSNDATAKVEDWGDTFGLRKVKDIVAALEGDKVAQRGLPLAVAFPYGGYYVMRSGWSGESAYMLFKASRIGVGHMHEDANSLVLTAYGRQLLIDSGNFNYADDERSRRINAYFYSSSAHNTISVDGFSQARLRRQSTNPEHLAASRKPIGCRWIAQADLVLAEGEYADAYGDAVRDVRHNRQVLYVMPDLWIVTDRLYAAEPHTYTLTWQMSAEFAPEEIRLCDDGEVSTTSGTGANLHIRYFGGESGRNTVMLYGRSEPDYAGWQAYAYDRMRESADIRIEWQGSRQEVFVSLLHPMEGTTGTVRDCRPLHDAADRWRGFELLNDEGTRVVYKAAAAAETLNWGVISCIAEMLLLRTSPDGSMNGLALGCTSLEAEGKSVYDGAGAAAAHDIRFAESGGRWRIDRL